MRLVPQWCLFQFWNMVSKEPAERRLETDAHICTSVFLIGSKLVTNCHGKVMTCLTEIMAQNIYYVLKSCL